MGQINKTPIKKYSTQRDEIWYVKYLICKRNNQTRNLNWFDISSSGQNDINIRRLIIGSIIQK